LSFTTNHHRPDRSTSTIYLPPTHVEYNVRSNITNETVYHCRGLLCAIGDKVPGVSRQVSHKASYSR
jgi:hypothetical protein